MLIRHAIISENKLSNKFNFWNNWLRKRDVRETTIKRIYWWSLVRYTLVLTTYVFAKYFCNFNVIRRSIYDVPPNWLHNHNSWLRRKFSFIYNFIYKWSLFSLFNGVIIRLSLFSMSLLLRLHQNSHLRFSLRNMQHKRFGEIILFTSEHISLTLS